MSSRPTLRTACLLVALASTPARADEVRRTDGSGIPGRLLGLVFEDQGGGVHALTRDEVLVATVSAGAYPRGAAPVPADAGGSWGRRVPGPPAPAAFPPGSIGLGIELTYQGLTSGPDSPQVLGEQDPGDFAEVFAYKPENVKNRGAWLLLGNATRLVNTKETAFGDPEELALVRQLLQDPTQTRETILARIDEARVWHHRMVYRFHQPVAIPAGVYNIYVNFSRLKRHKIWNSVQLVPDKPVILQYSWATHITFGQ